METKRYEMKIGDSKYRLYEGTLEGALLTNYEGEGDIAKEARTNIWMSLWIQKILADLRLQYNLPVYMVMGRLIRFGTAIVQHKYDKKLKQLLQLWGKIRWSENEEVKHLEARSYTVNGMADARRVFIRMPKLSSDILGGFSSAINTEKAGMIRLAMYHAIARSEKLISEKNKRYAESEIAKFDKKINDATTLLTVIDTYIIQEEKEEKEGDINECRKSI